MLETPLPPVDTDIFLLRCDPSNSEFTLSTGNGKGKKTFDSFDAAYEHAESRASSETPMVLYNAQGARVCGTTILPLEPELLKAREHWREVMGLYDLRGPEPTMALFCDAAD